VIRARSLRRPFLVARVTLLSCIVIGQALLTGPSPASAQSAGAYTGWAMEAYPDLTATDFVSTLRRMRDNGANLVWLGHSNPAEVNPSASEVGLSYATFAAATNQDDPQHAAALSILAGQSRALDAARAVGLRVVLPVNYRTQMGAAWNAGHNASLRRGPDGSVLDFGGQDASPYAGDFRADTVRYYRWIDQNFVAPYRDVILMLNLADEPTGMDYSPAADSTFSASAGYAFAGVGSDPLRVTALGAFQSHVMVDFVTWAAQQWLSIDPSMTVTASFDGGPGRKNQQAPAIEAIFREAPPNFQPAWDAYPRDGFPTDSLDDSDLAGLSNFLGTLGHFSARYGRSYWLWSSGNSYGLSGGSSDPSTIADALVNLRMLADVSKQAGGLLRGIAIWNYNLRGQGLYNDGYHPPYSPDDLFARVTATLPAIRQILQGSIGPGSDVLVLAPNALPDREIGAGRLADIWRYRGYNFSDLVSLARAGANAAVVSTLAGEDLSHVRMIVVLARDASDLTASDVAAIRAYRSGGGVIVDGENVERPLQLKAQWTYPGNAPELYFATVYTKAQAGPVASLGIPQVVNSFAIRGPSELIAYGGTTIDRADEVHAWFSLAAPATAVAYDRSGIAGVATAVGPGLVAIPTERHAFSLLTTSAAIQTIATSDRFFPQTGFRVGDDAIWDYFTRRGGVATFGYPVSRSFRFEGFTVQFFQRRIIQLTSTGSPRLLNVLDPGLLPYTSFNGASLPAFDPTLVAAAPPATDATGTIDFVRARVQDSFRGLPTAFNQSYWSTVSAGTALPEGGDRGLLPGFDLELWGVPTSGPMLDPQNHNVVYQRFQRGVMTYDGACGCTQGVLLADYLKGILTGNNLPPDLTQEAQGNPLYRQYDSSQPGWVHNASVLPNTDLTNAFTPG
jgi:hypothetical protein